MIGIFGAAFFLGMIFNATPGAVFAETIRHGVSGGFRPALYVQIGSLVGDALWALLGLVGIGLLLQMDLVALPIAILGTLYLFWLSWDAWCTSSKDNIVGIENGSGDASSRRALRSGMLLSITNPQNVVFWAAIGSALGSIGVQQPEMKDYAVFFSGFMVSSLVWSFVCASLVHGVFNNVSKSWASITYRICALSFLVLAVVSANNIFSKI